MGDQTMINVLQIVLSSILIILCLLQSDKAEGVLSLTSREISLFKKSKEGPYHKILSISTAIVGGLLFLSIIVPYFA